MQDLCTERREGLSLAGRGGFHLIVIGANLGITVQSFSRATFLSSTLTDVIGFMDVSRSVAVGNVPSVMARRLFARLDVSLPRQSARKAPGTTSRRFFSAADPRLSQSTGNVQAVVSSNGCGSCSQHCDQKEGCIVTLPPSEQGKRKRRGGWCWLHARLRLERMCDRGFHFGVTSRNL